jgi:hypothetical protein
MISPAMRYHIHVKLVLDTDVVVAVLRSPTGASTAFLKCLDAGRERCFPAMPLASSAPSRVA